MTALARLDITPFSIAFSCLGRFWQRQRSLRTSPSCAPCGPERVVRRKEAVVKAAEGWVKKERAVEAREVVGWEEAARGRRRHHHN